MADDFWGTKEEADRLGGRIRAARGGGEGGGGSAAARPSQPAPPPQPAVPRGTQAGQAFRRAAGSAARAAQAAMDTGVAQLERGVNVATLPSRQIGGDIVDFSRAVRGEAARQDAGAPLPAFRLARPVIFGNRAANGGTGAGTGAGTPAPDQARRRATVRGGAPMAGSFNRGRAAVVGASQPASPAAGDPNTITYSDGRTVSVAGAPAAPGPAAPAGLARPALDPAAAPAPTLDGRARSGAATADALAAARTVRNQAAQVLAPGTAANELMRRLEIAQRSYFTRGSPSARSALAQAYLGQLGAQNAAGAEFQRQAGQNIAAGVEADVDQVVGAQDAVARERLQRQALEGQLALGDQEANRPTVLGGTADGILRLQRGGQAAAIVDEQGRPIREARQQGGALTPQDLLKAYTDERQSILSSPMPPNERQAALAELDADPLYAPLRGVAEGPPPEAIALLLANPDRADQFDEVFGPGAAARYINR